jgi:long-chain acyl-CoA synthetase
VPISGPSVDEPVAIADLLRVGLESKPDDFALVSSANRWTWRELELATKRLAAAYLGLGLTSGDRIASLMPNRATLLLHYIACLKAGLVAVPLNYRYTAPEIDHALDISGASLFLVHAERLAEVAACSQVKDLPLGVISHEAPDDAKPNLQTLMARESAVRGLPSPSVKDPAIIFFTSGSTGPAKGITHSFETFGWRLSALRVACALSASDAFLGASSLSHSAALSLCLAALVTGARVVIARRYDSDEVLGLLRAERPTVLWILPAALFALLRSGQATRKDFSSLRLCISGGDKVPADLAREFEDLTGKRIQECYGMTEAGMITFAAARTRSGSLGGPIPGMVLSIRDEHGRELPPGAEGRLWVKTRSLMAGYWGDPQATAAVTQDDWLNTGDLVVADADGSLQFRGRLKQIIVHDGSNICPQEVEDALLQHPAVASAGVVGVRDPLHGENVRAYVTLKSGATRPSAEALIQFARARVGYKAPEVIEFLSEMPLTATGKLDRRSLLRRATEGHRGESSR